MPYEPIVPRIRNVKIRLEKYRNIDPITNCWEWTKAKDKDGYGLITINSVVRRVHRVSFEEFNGPIPNGLSVLHSCDNPPCFNPSHLEAGTSQKNRQDAFARGRITAEAMKEWFKKRTARRHAAQTHCKHGHEFNEKNTRWKGTARSCRECDRIAHLKKRRIDRSC